VRRARWLYMAAQAARLVPMALYKLEALTDDVEVFAIWWRRVTMPLPGGVGVGGGISFDKGPLYLDIGDEANFVSAVGKVNNVANPPLPQTVGESAIIADVLRVTRTSDADRPSDQDL